ncbi:MAG: DUF4823 domain-containing protein [Methylophilus sp.]|uniref:DUF4823 domain-containing protein n=1 Tax=Methylophilus sp. TaxID=29541 RepID=UPI003FA123AE
MIKNLSIISAGLLLTACADTHHLIKNNPVETRLSAEATVYISVPNDGIYGAKTYHGSGQNTAQIIYSAFAKHTRAVTVGRTIQSFNEALATARETGKNYLVYPTILQWEDRATEWSGIPDKVEVKVEVIDATTASTVTSAVVKGKSGLATFGGDHPQDLLPKPVEKFVSSIY